jgi:hypothetical protein
MLRKQQLCDLICQHGAPYIAIQPSVAAKCQDSMSVTAPALYFHLTDYLNYMNSACISFKIKRQAIIRLSTLIVQGANNLLNLSVATLLLANMVSTSKHHLSGVNTEGIINLRFLILKPVILFLTINLLLPILQWHKQFIITMNL